MGAQAARRCFTGQSNGGIPWFNQRSARASERHLRIFDVRTPKMADILCHKESTVFWWKGLRRVCFETRLNQTGNANN
jgi:hypothetical protein